MSSPIRGSWSGASSLSLSRFGLTKLEPSMMEEKESWEKWFMGWGLRVLGFRFRVSGVGLSDRRWAMRRVDRSQQRAVVAHLV